jgi:hypothetical protein
LIIVKKGEIRDQADKCDTSAKKEKKAGNESTFSELQNVLSLLPTGPSTSCFCWEHLA